jgi:hypothetical protein
MITSDLQAMDDKGDRITTDCPAHPPMMWDDQLDLDDVLAKII